MSDRVHCTLAINPGSTSTKIGVFQEDEPIFEEVIRHASGVLQRYPRVVEQKEFRLETILRVVDQKGIDLTVLDAVVSRGGLLRPIPGGTYRITDAMLADLQSEKYGEHASNLGAMIAQQLMRSLEIPGFIVDPVVVDELQPEARISGLPAIERRSIFHALNQKAVARQIAGELGKSYEQLNLIVAHMGGGITVGAHRKGNVIDVNNGLNGEGPFSPERAGTVPFGDLVKLSFSGKYFPREVMRLLVGQGGLVSYLGTSDAREIEQRIEQGDEQASLVYTAMAYQVAKEIAANGAVLEGKIDHIILTGGLAYGERLVAMIRQRVEWLAPVSVIPGENELKALVQGALRVLHGEEDAKEYPQPVKGRTKSEVLVRG